MIYKLAGVAERAGSASTVTISKFTDGVEIKSQAQASAT
jgi:hypothetical protein